MPSKRSIVAAAAISTAIIGSAATGATAARLIDSSDIRNNSVRGVDVKNGTVTSADLATPIGDTEYIKWSGTVTGGFEPKFTQYTVKGPASVSLTYGTADGIRPDCQAFGFRLGSSETQTAYAYLGSISDDREFFVGTSPQVVPAGEEMNLTAQNFPCVHDQANDGIINFTAVFAVTPFDPAEGRVIK